ncbi:MAG: pallilysin-related adhesin [Spirochaetaceae bacterium]|nr:pallilysin-related adhesin [Spirochaetaceae bacterium]MCF7948185.1 pallilysin-related adhesin [Spirochaetia bacterium]MCF7950801.1 pallilysin-related adhesin [Spirochaetaceae bacterium]
MKTHLFPVILGAAILVTACDPSFSKDNSPYLQEPKKVNLDSKQGQEAGTTRPSGDNYQEENRQFPRVQLPPGYQLVQLVDVNLDLDRYEEQVLVAQDTESEKNNIYLLVADYDAIRDAYSITWRSDTVTERRKGLQVTVIDTTGDHNLEIVCSGINNDGLQTMDIFRRTTSPDEFGLYFDRILSLEVNGTIEVQEDKRSQSYQNGLSNGSSYPVVTSSADTESDRMSDIIKRTYIWRNDSRSYEQVLEKKVSGQEVEDRRLKELFESGSEAFEEFLSGPWMYTKNTGRNTPRSQRSLIHFNPIEKTITLYSGNVQEIYTWTSSHRFLANSLAIRGENEIVPFMRIYISAYIEDLNNIRLQIYDINSHNGQRNTNTSWSGMYQKIGDSLQSTFLSSSPSYGEEGNAHLPRLTGVYESDVGDKLTFDPPYFTLERDGVQHSGGFSVYSMGSDVLELKVLSSQGIVVERLCYSFDYFEERKSNEITRRIVLVPGKIGVNGFIPTEKQPLRYEQVEKIEDQ